MNRVEIANSVIMLMDLTSLEDVESLESTEKLCKSAVSPFGNVASVCVWPRFVPYAKKYLSDTKIAVATVTNFPSGGVDIEIAIAETKAALAYGADEVSLVLPYRAWMWGKKELALELVTACKLICGKKPLKVILETGSFRKPERITQVALDVIKTGVDFIKTSTGKTELSASKEAAEAILVAIKESGGKVGFIASGGIKTVDDGIVYLQLAEQIMGQGWIHQNSFRFGASGLLKNVLQLLQDR